jgi:hypothetical protein
MMRAVVAGGKLKAYGRAFGSDNLLEGAMFAKFVWVEGKEVVYASKSRGSS